MGPESGLAPALVSGSSAIRDRLHQPPHARQASKPDQGGISRGPLPLAKVMLFRSLRSRRADFRRGRPRPGLHQGDADSGRRGARQSRRRAERGGDRRQLSAAAGRGRPGGHRLCRWRASASSRSTGAASHEARGRREPAARTSSAHSRRTLIPVQPPRQPVLPRQRADDAVGEVHQGQHHDQAGAEDVDLAPPRVPCPAPRFRLPARRREAYFRRRRDLARAWENDDGERAEEEQPRGQEAQGGQEEDPRDGGRRGGHAGQAQARRGGRGEQEIAGCRRSARPGAGGRGRA